MVDVGVRKHDGVEFARLRAKVPILGVTLGPVPLENTAVQKQSERIGLEQMLTARDFSGGAEKSQPHRAGGGDGSEVTIAPC